MKTAVIFSGGAFSMPEWTSLPEEAVYLCADSGLCQSVGNGAGLDIGRL